MTVDGHHSLAHTNGRHGSADGPVDGQAGVTDLDRDLDDQRMPDKPRVISEDDRLRYEGYLAQILSALGLDLDTPSTSATPRRFLRALLDTTVGYEGDPQLLTAFPTECRGGANCEVAQSSRARSRSSPCVSTMPCHSSEMSTWGM